MAQLVLGIGGALGGSALGSPLLGVAFSAIGSAAGAYIDSLWMGGPNSAPVAPNSIDLKVVADSYGQPINVPYGKIAVAGTMIASSNLIPTKQDVEVGGGLGLGTEGSAGAVYTYRATFAVLLGEPPIGKTIKVLRILADGKRIYDVRPQARNVKRRGATFHFYEGSADQLPDPWMQSYFGADITPAYRGRAYVVIRNLQLADFGNHIPNLKCEVITEGAEAHAFSQVSVANGSHASGTLAFDPNSNVVIKLGGNTGNVAKIDGRLVTVLLGPSEVFSHVTGTMVFGNDGYLYVPQLAAGLGGTSNFAPWSKVDPSSFAIVDQVGARSDTFDNATHSLLGLNAWLKSRAGWPYLIGIVNGGFFVGNEIDVVSIGQLEDGLGLALETQMRFVGKMRTQGSSDRAYDDAEFDLSSLEITNGGSGPVAEFDIWATVGGHLYRLHMTDNFVAGGGLIAGGPNGANPITEEEDIDLSSAWSVSGTATMSFFEDEHSVIINRGRKIIKYNLDSRTVTGAELDIGSLGASGAEMRQGPVNGLMYFVPGGGHLVLEVDVVAWVVNRTIDLHDWGSFAGGDQQYDAADNALWIADNDTATKIFLDRIDDSGTITLAEIVSDICQRAGLSTSDFDVAELTDTVRGYIINRVTPARDAIAPLGSAFFFQAVESDFKIKFKKLGGSVVRALTADDVGAYPDSSQRPSVIDITDANPRTLPRRVNVRYINAGQFYETSVQSDQRHQAVTPNSASDIMLDLPIVLTDAEAKDIATKALAKIWTNSRKYSLAVSNKEQRLDPIDVISVDDGTTVHRMGIDIQDLGMDGTIKLSATREEVEVYESGNLVGAGNGSGPPQDPVAGHTEVELLDVVLLRDGDNTSGFYLAAAPDTGDADAWTGFIVLRSIDAGISYTVFASGAQAALIAHATDALPAPRAWTTWDRVNSVTIRPNPGAAAPTASTEAAVLNGANRALLGNEVIQFVDVEDNSDGTYTLSTLLRGRRGSDPFIGEHQIGDLFVLLDFAVVANELDPDLGLPRFFKFQSAGDSTLPTIYRVFTDRGVRLKPLTAADPKLADAGGGDLELTWKRRSRIGGENDWADGLVTIPLGESTESYEVDILDGDDVVRTISSSTPDIAYSSADQTADFGGNQTSLEVVIYQLSATVGRGFGLAAAVAVGGP